MRASSEERGPDQAELGRATAALRDARVGGNYWGLQPVMPTPSYILIRVRDAARRARLIESSAGQKPVLCWLDAEARQSTDSGTATVSGDCDPWHLVGGAAAVFADPDDEIVAIAALCGVPVYGPDGVTAGDVDDILGARLAGSWEYVDPFTGDAMSLAEAIALCAHWRTLIDGNRRFDAAIGFAGWKQQTAAPLLWPGTRGLPFLDRVGNGGSGATLAAWKSRVAPASRARLEQGNRKLVEVEDGFIRSVGLGADCVPPLSLVVDGLGIYFDPAGPSDLEQLLENHRFDPELLHRARRLRQMVVAAGLSKYAVGGAGLARRGDRPHVLVPGQVEDDRSVLCGGGAVTTNVELLRRVRADRPDAFIIYKPHPDVQAGHRVGTVGAELAATLADEIVLDQSITSLIDLCDEVHVNTSLAGFEALLRGRPVTTHGVPFYAGWGLTRDLGAVPERRRRRLALDEMVAAVLLLYPRYLDPVTGLPCTAEILVRRLAEGEGRSAGGPLVPLRRLQGRLKQRLSQLTGRLQP